MLSAKRSRVMSIALACVHRRLASGVALEAVGVWTSSHRFTDTQPTIGSWSPRNWKTI